MKFLYKIDPLITNVISALTEKNSNTDGEPQKKVSFGGRIIEVLVETGKKTVCILLATVTILITIVTLPILALALIIAVTRDRLYKIFSHVDHHDSRAWLPQVLFAALYSPMIAYELGKYIFSNDKEE